MRNLDDMRQRAATALEKILGRIPGDDIESRMSAESQLMWAGLKASPPDFERAMDHAERLAQLAADNPDVKPHWLLNSLVPALRVLGSDRDEDGDVQFDSISSAG